MRGGSYTSGSTYGMYVNGSGDSQFARTFDATGPYASRVGTEYVGAQGQNSQQAGVPSAEQLKLVQSAGKRRKNRRGGFFGEVINQAIVPFGLLGLQQTYRKKSRGGKGTRKRAR
jgi:hypothetical protein